MITHIGKEKYDTLKDSFIKAKFSFEEVQTSTKRYLKKGEARFYLSSNPQEETILNPQTLGLVMSAKHEIVKNYMSRAEPFPDSTDINLFNCVADTKSHWEGEVFQLDLNSAYITEAKNLGLLSEEKYNRFFLKRKIKGREAKRGHKIKEQGFEGFEYCHPKVSRLLALGVLATKKDVHMYRMGEYKKSKHEYNREEANIFFYIAAKIGGYMAKLIDKYRGLCLFSYVDAIFVKPEAVQRIKEEFRSIGHEVKEKLCYINKSGTKFSSTEIGGDGEILETKKYYLSKSQQVDWLLSYAENTDFIKNLVGEIREGLALGEIKREDAKKVLNFAGKDYLIGSELDKKYIAAQVNRVGFCLEDLYRIKAKIQIEISDAFGVIDSFLIDKLFQVSEKIELEKKRKEGTGIDQLETNTMILSMEVI